ncbi:hypothetical protein [Pasteurella testudinis]
MAGQKAVSFVEQQLL